MKRLIICMALVSLSSGFALAAPGAENSGDYAAENTNDTLQKSNDHDLRSARFLGASNDFRWASNAAAVPAALVVSPTILGAALGAAEGTPTTVAAGAALGAINTFRMFRSQFGSSGAKVIIAATLAAPFALRAISNQLGNRAEYHTEASRQLSKVLATRSRAPAQDPLNGPADFAQ